MMPALSGSHAVRSNMAACSQQLLAAPGRGRARRRAAAAVAALAPLPPPSLAAAPLAAVVPNFPRIGGQPVRDWIGQAVENLPGFNGDDLARLLLPDLVGLVDGPSALITLTLVLAFVYWEGGILLRQLRARRAAQQRQREREQQQRRRQDGGEAGAADEAAAAAAAGAAHEDEEHHDVHPPRLETPLDRARHERRRGLGWLALTTAGLIWLTGVVNNPAPFQP